MSNEEVIKRLIEKNITLATAESCTGGMLGKLITEVPGASKIYGFGFITYANEAKISVLGVNSETLEKHGAVSEQTALEMATGALRVSGADIAVSITGIAGPGGGTKEKPVGLVYVAIADKETAEVKRLLLNGDRESIRKETCENVFLLINSKI